MSDTRDELHSEIFRASRFADWIFHDVRLDCDDAAYVRTAERLNNIDEQFGRDALFGMTGWWAISAYWRLEEAHHLRGADRAPDLVPTNVEEILEKGEQSIEKRRAFVSAQQFISTLTHDDVEMSLAIFNAAYDSSVEDCRALMYNVLLMSVRIYDTAERMRRA